MKSVGTALAFLADTTDQLEERTIPMALFQLPLSILVYVASY